MMREVLRMWSRFENGIVLPLVSTIAGTVTLTQCGSGAGMERG